MAKHTYRFDVTLFAGITVEASSEKQARKRLDEMLKGMEVSLQDETHMVEGIAVSSADEAFPIIEVDGEFVD